MKMGNEDMVDLAQPDPEFAKLHLGTLAAID